MAQIEEQVARMQQILAPYIKPREEASSIRRILGLYIQSQVEKHKLGVALSLVNSSATVTPDKKSRGLVIDYLNALSANQAARDDYAAARQQLRSIVPTRPPTTPLGNPLNDHLEISKLHQKKQKLQIVYNYLDQLSLQQTDLAQRGELGSILTEAVPLPKIPGKVISGIVTESSGGSQAAIPSILGQAEKVLLKAKLSLRREERLLERAQEAAEIDPEELSDAMKSEALNVTRNELIRWIESELAKASSTEDGEENEPTAGEARSSRKEEGQASGSQKERLEEITEHYNEYIAARSTLVQLLKQPLKPRTSVAKHQHGHVAAETTQCNPTAHLLTPYIAHLLAVSQEQKSLILHKSHLNASLTKQSQEMCQGLDYLAEESQLLPRYPTTGTLKPKLGPLPDFSGTTSEKLDSSARAKAWVHAADCAKIATLEAVAEKVEQGELSLEGSMAALGEIEGLLGRSRQPKSRVVDDDSKTDIWLEGTSGNGIKHRGSEKERSGRPDDIWAALDLKKGLGKK